MTSSRQAAYLVGMVGRAPRGAGATVYFGVALLTTGALVPATGWIRALRPIVDVEIATRLEAGGALFGVGLMALGAFMLLTAVIRYAGLCGDVRTTVVEDRQPENRRQLILLFIILLAATALRLHALESGLWLDELVTLTLYARPTLGEIVTTYDSQNQHLLYSVLAHASLLAFGEGAWALRLPAVFFGVASLWAVYYFGRQVTSDGEAVFASALLAFSYHHIWFSQNGRGYTGLLFFALLSSGILLRAMREATLTLWAWYALSVAAGMWIHVTMAFLVPAQLVVAVIKLSRTKQLSPGRRWLLPVWGLVLAALLTFQLYALVLPQFVGAGLTESTTVTAWNSLAWTIRETASGLRVDVAAGALLALGIAGAGILSFARRKPAVLILFFVPAMLGTLAMAALQHPLWPRFFFFLCGFGALVAVRSFGAMVERMAALLRWGPSWTTRIARVATAVAIAASAVTTSEAFGPKQDYAGARDFIVKESSPGDAAAAVGLASIPYRYYAPEWPTANDAEQLRAIRGASRRTWVVVTMSMQLESDHPDIAALLRREFEVVARFGGTLRGGEVLVYRSLGSAVRSESHNGVCHVRWLRGRQTVRAS